MKSILNLNLFLDKLLFYTVSFCTATFFISVIFTIITRYFHLAIQSTTEISRLFFIWACFLAAAITYRKKAHVAISFFTDLFNYKIQKLITRINSALILVFFTLMLAFGIKVSTELWQTEFPMLKISQGWLYLSVPVSSVFFILYSFENLIVLTRK